VKQGASWAFRHRFRGEMVEAPALPRALLLDTELPDLLFFGFEPAGVG